MTETTIAVAVGLIRNQDGTLLLCQRLPEKSYPLKWEFPGGKVEPGESPEAALVRELCEELEIEAEAGALYHRQTSHYAVDDKTFEVFYFIVERWRGELRNRVFADVRWVDPADLPAFDILEGNLEICRRLVADATSDGARR